MKYIIVGLGNFGASLGQKLTSQGNEVIGIDTSAAKVEAYREKITYTVQLDATDELAVSGLPLKSTDIVIIGIGEDQGANVMATALFKNLEVKRLISRSINPLHEKVLEAIGVDEIVRPEEETAERWAKKLCLINVVDSFELNDDFSIIEATVPKEYVSKTLKEVGFRSKYNLLVLTIIKQVTVNPLLGSPKTENQVQGVASAEDVLEQGDILVLYGSNKDLQHFLKQKVR